MGTPRHNGMKIKWVSKEKATSAYSRREERIFSPLTYRMISPEVQERIDEIRSIPSLRK